MFYLAVAVGWFLAVVVCWVFTWIFLGGFVSLVSWDSVYMDMSEWPSVLRFTYAVVCVTMTGVFSYVSFVAACKEDFKIKFNNQFNKE